jgi:peptide deformylase
MSLLDMFDKSPEAQQRKAEKQFSKDVNKLMPADARGGKVLGLEIWPSASLSSECEYVEDFSEIPALIKDMAMTMYMTGGVGLAANQVGVTKRVFVMDVSGNGTGLRVFVNPAIINVSADVLKMQEGCLSFPSVRAVIERPQKVELRAFHENGQPFEVILDGWSARVALHEIEHLTGETWLDSMGDLQKKMALKKLKKLGQSVKVGERIAAKRKRSRARRR